MPSDLEVKAWHETAQNCVKTGNLKTSWVTVSFEGEFRLLNQLIFMSSIKIISVDVINKSSWLQKRYICLSALVYKVNMN
jgi:hypothetical protein